MFKRITAFFLSLLTAFLSLFGVSFRQEESKMIDVVMTEKAAPGANEKTRALQTLFEAVKMHQPTVTACAEKKPFAGDDRITAVYFDGEVCGGKQSEVFAYIGFPENASAENPVPGMVLLHGGAGHAYAEWVRYWVDQGYAAISVDGFGQEPSDGLYDGTAWTVNPDSHPTIDELRSADKPLTEQWFYYYITDVLLANNILRTDARVQTDKIGLTGISWGGIGTTVAMCYDDRFAFAVPVYGCGFLDSGSASISPLFGETVSEIWEPSRLLREVEMPVLFINGDDDPFFSAGATTASAANVKNGSLLYIPSLPHDQNTGAGIPEIVRFANAQNGIGDGDLKIQSVSFDGTQAVLKLDVPQDVSCLKAYVYFRSEPLTYNGLNIETKWNKRIGMVAGDTVNVRVPENAEMFWISVQGKSGTLLDRKDARASTGVYTRDQLLNEGCYRKMLDTEKLADNITKTVRKDMAEGKVGGAELLVDQCGQRVFDSTFGCKSVGGEALTKDTVYRLASMTKPVTAVALLLEYERGNIDIYADVSDYLDGYKDMTVGRMEDGKVVADHKAQNSVKVYQLVAHTSGIGSGTVGEALYASIPRKELTVQRVAEFFADQPLSYDPGTSQEYSTAAFDVAARIIEIVSGMPYDEYLKVNLFDPLGMKDTTFAPTPEQWDRMITIFDRDENGNPRNGKTAEGCVFGSFPTTYCAAGAALASTGEDYMKFAEMLLNEGKAADGTRILSPEMIRLMRTPAVSEEIMPGSQRWGLGVRVIVNGDNTLPKDSFGWSGAYGTHYWIDPTNRIAAVYMKNSLYDGGAGSKTSVQFEKDVMKALKK